MYTSEYRIPLECEEDFIDYLNLNKLEYKESNRDDKFVYIILTDSEDGHLDTEDELNDLMYRAGLLC